MSSAFDNMDHIILLYRLLNCFGVKIPKLAWFQSYLCNRSQSVVVNNTVFFSFSKYLPACFKA